MKASLIFKPVSVDLNAASLMFQFYMAGVMDLNFPVILNHAVLAVGYRHDQKIGKDFWKKKTHGVKAGE